ncbi:DUF2971 domain-containing protein [Pseudomonas sp. N3-W]|uniref:DUF2971 domain-containing protein n=1 Tax=Pseudomonas sp. N3-W TaxID=2975049 RepID=UPI00217E5EFE|nr:DUF2971 domain-containing protein [Pseudomonas sp. N3-W]UWF51844.1 DUF2971 domain-containing protein [Pseudomonas sp. N3-W]
MPVFKYYRPNVYFEKAVRYNELYFSANHELNDPHDLKAKYYFEDGIGLWKKLLSLQAPFDTWNINNFIGGSDEALLVGLNDLFKGMQFDSIEGSIKQVVENKSKELAELFTSSMRKPISFPVGQEFLKDAPPEYVAQLCKLSLIELLMRAVNHNFYSVSFSGTALNPMMWAHYAEGFKGCVVIYDVLSEGEIILRQNLFAKEESEYFFRKVNYLNEEKRIPVLECATGVKDKVQKAFLQKNAFWHYESEFRLLTVENLDSPRLAIANDKVINNRERVLHHDTNAILGVVFGPRCDSNFKEKIEHILRDNRLHHDGKPFFTFETELTFDGSVVVNTAYQCLCTNRSQMKRVFKGDEMNKLLFDLGIH